VATAVVVAVALAAVATAAVAAVAPAAAVTEPPEPQLKTKAVAHQPTAFLLAGRKKARCSLDPAVERARVGRIVAASDVSAHAVLSVHESGQLPDLAQYFSARITDTSAKNKVRPKLGA
jgi:hypothetical protein